ncbi:MAG: hypothetical protein AB7N65_00035 [Vicinamibacterales bacterium]
MAHISFLLDRLEDPFEMFPLHAVSGQLGELVNETGLRQYDRNGPYGVSEKCRSVEDEHDVAMEQLFIGSAFVLCQAAITQAISIATKVHEIAGKPSHLPCGKPAIMATMAPVHQESGLSKIAIVDAAANYFKHQYEWDDDWRGPDRARDTIALVVRLGMEPRHEYNLSRALRVLEVSESDMSPMARLIQDWRARLAAHFRTVLNEPSP